VKNEVETLRLKVSILEDQLRATVQDLEEFRSLLIASQQENASLVRQLEELQKKK
jgi:hypothetical protein